MRSLPLTPALVLATLAGCTCGGQRALLARVEVTPELLASCVALEVTSTSGELLQSVRVVRTDPSSLRIAVYQGELPEEIRLRARALVGDACGDPLAASTVSTEQPAVFKTGEVPEVVLTVGMPGAEVDRDRDGFVGADFAGPDCNDSDGAVHPGAAEICSPGFDNNCDGNVGCADPSCSATQCAAPEPTQVAVTSAPSTLTAGVCHPTPLVVEVKDATGETVALPAAITVGLSPSPAMELAFHAQAGCGDAPLTQLSLPQGSSGGSLYLRATRPVSTTQVTVSPPAGLTGDSTPVTLVAGPVSSAAFNPTSATAQAGTCFSPVELAFFDAFDNPSSFPASSSITLTSTPPGGIGLFGAGGCTGPVGFIPVAAGATSGILSFEGTASGPRTLTAAVPGAGTVGMPVTVTSGPPSVLAFTSAEQSLLAGACTAPLVVQSQDDNGNAAPVSSPLTLDLTSTPATGLTYYADAACTQPVTQVVMGTSQSEATFYAKAVTGTAYTLKVNTSASQNLSVRSTVRTGTCTVGSGATSVDCTVNPPLFDRNKAFMVFQATGAQTTPESASVACSLTSTSNISCGRVGSSGAVQIRWHTVERPSGLTVQHLTQPCVASLVTNVAIAPVASMASTFVLASQTRPGTGEYDNNEFRTVELTAVDQVRLTTEEAFCDGGEFRLQVVQWAGASVTRGKFGGIASDDANQDVTGLSSVDESRTLLLYSHSTGAIGTDICEVMVRGEMTGPTSLTFSRHNTGSVNCLDEDIDEVAWTRVELPPGNVVQEVTTSIATSNTQQETPITAVDLTRSVSFSGAQWHGGQSSGEGDYWNNDILGEMAALHSLPSANTLRLNRGSALAPAKFTSYVLQVLP